MSPLHQFSVEFSDAEDALPSLERLWGVAEAVFDVAVAEPTGTGLGLQVEQALQVLAGLRVSFLGGGDQSESFDSAGVVGGDVGGVVEAFSGVVVLADAVEGAAEIDEEVGVLRVEIEGILEAGGGEGVFSLGKELGREAAQVLQVGGVGGDQRVGYGGVGGRLSGRGVVAAAVR